MILPYVLLLLSLLDFSLRLLRLLLLLLNGLLNKRLRETYLTFQRQDSLIEGMEDFGLLLFLERGEEDLHHLVEELFCDSEVPVTLRHRPANVEARAI